MTLSIIIVSHNVKFFLEQCICSVSRAMDRLRDSGRSAEVIVFDNDSSDGSTDYLAIRFPWVTLLRSTHNLGFARANNQACMHAAGQYILFLNPDTILEEQTLEKCIDFLEQHDHAGALGVRMLDGKGNFLRESVRGFPTSWAAFCKYSGLTNLFPRSRRLAGYYMGELDKSVDQQVEVLSGACMFVRREVLDRTGGFDERFFMYAEDIDLSYRIRQAGFSNYYCAGARILHFKGESTRRDPRYARLFYQAMEQFMQKYSMSYGPGLARFMLRAMVRTRALIAALSYVLTPSRRNDKPVQRATLLWGDALSIKEIDSRAFIGVWHLVQHTNAADQIVFCEGPGYSFEEIITQMETRVAPRQYRIHGYQTDSIVGSDASWLQGESFACS
jgi:GT2 family glycosyltransferase